MRPTITGANQHSKIVFQESEEVIREQALLITPCDTCIQIEQGDQLINLNYETVSDLCALLKKMKAPD